MPFIYKITNCITGKSYVGKTICSVDKRWREHKFAAANNRNYPLYRAMRKYGIENFKIEEIECCSADILSEREIYWIKELGTFNNGYNATLGGDGTYQIDYATVFEVYCLTESALITAKILDISTRSVTRVLRMYEIPPSQSHDIPHRGVSVNMFSTSGEYIKTFSSALQAAYNVAPNCKNPRFVAKHIQDACEGRRKTVSGYKWEYMIPENFEDEDW